MLMLISFILALQKTCENIKPLVVDNAVLGFKVFINQTLNGFCGNKMDVNLISILLIFGFFGINKSQYYVCIIDSCFTGKDF
jgi:hypothetical protein